ncbi:hypothetical protein LLEC1_00796 [Akanthomyces lecanii]|uniref:C2H2-type domain-containing protein n=1 Tax=Cordyceps confragosa TaxID=2714763 RepID=A0A179I627_CORDF|nr:hypothetical protein LLEC1_00796 [Akanthomyces lecanii]
MSHIAPRPPQRPAHRRTPSNPQAPDRRVELVDKLESCIEDVLEATKAYKSPQQQSAHRNANQMFQQRVLASRGQMGNMSDQDWLGTMMQCLNESMRTQQSSFVRNTTLDVALKTFVSSIFDVLGPAYFQEPFDKYMAISRPKSSDNATAGFQATGKSRIISPSREISSNQNLMHRSNPQYLPPPATHAASLPSTHQQLAQRPAKSIASGAVTLLQNEIHGMPIIQRPLPAARQPGRPPKRQSPVEAPNPPARKRAYTCEALRQAAGPMGPPPTPAQSRPSLGNPHKQRLCIDFWDVQQERDARKRQAILSYGGKWYVFQCHQHEDVLFFKTAEGARHHMMTRHAFPNQHIDFLDIIQELGVEVMNCDVARAEKSNLEAVDMWNRVGSNSRPQNGADIRPETSIRIPVPAQTHGPTTSRPGSISGYSPALCSVPVTPPPARIDSPSTVLCSDVESSSDTTADQKNVNIKIETTEKELDSFTTRPSVGESASSQICPTQPSQPAGRATGSLDGSSKGLTPTANAGSNLLATDGGFEVSESTERPQSVRANEKSLDASGGSETSTTPATEKSDIAEHVPDLTPDSPDSSELSEPPTLVADDELEEGEVDESCIRVASCSTIQSDRTPRSSQPNKKQKRRISAAGSAPSTPSEQRKRLPATPKSSQKKRKQRQAFRSPAQETGPSAHDQFKTRACKKCPERFYFRAQLATHMNSEHPELEKIPRLHVPSTLCIIRSRCHDLVNRNHVIATEAASNRLLVQRVADRHEGRLRADLGRRLLHQPRDAGAVCHGRLRRPVLGNHLCDLEPRVGRRHGARIEHLAKGVDVDALRAGQVHRLGQPGRHGDEEQVDCEFRAEAHANLAARVCKVLVEDCPVCRLVDEHGEDYIGLTQDGSGCVCNGGARGPEGRAFGRCTIPDGQWEFLREIEGHGRAHEA